MKIFLQSFCIPSAQHEYFFFSTQQRTCYNTTYPFGLFYGKIPCLKFAPVTILYGGNGSGKTTLLNVIAEKLKLQRDARFNQSIFFRQYADACKVELNANILDIPRQSRFIASDDVFQHILATRKANEAIDTERVKSFESYQADAKRNNFGFDLNKPSDLDLLNRSIEAKRKSASQYVLDRVGINKVERSNGESALEYFFNAMQEDSLYLLDEPENSLSPAKQLELVEFLQNSARGAGDQFVIATHSPLILSIPGAKIYNLDANPVRTAKWHELENPRIYYEFFMKHAREFEKGKSVREDDED